MATCDIPNRSEYDSSGILTVIRKLWMAYRITKLELHGCWYQWQC